MAARSKLLTWNEVELWRVDLAVHDASLWDLLSEDERERSGQFLQRRDRDSFIQRRGWLRVTLGEMIGIPPESLLFERSSAGKLRITGQPLEFSVTSSFDIALFAISWSSAVGIDIEREDGGSPIDIVLPSGRRIQSVQEWTQYEAIVKAQGDGISRIDPDDSRFELFNFVPQEGYFASVARPRC